LQAGLSVSLATSQYGWFSQEVLLLPRSRNSSGYDGALDAITLSLYGGVLPTGDYDQDGWVSQSDYDLWRASYGSTTALLADGNNDGVVDAADYTVWRDHLGNGQPPILLSQATVPEPGAVALLLSVIPILVCRRRA
jgi:hypothetical protein